MSIRNVLTNPAYADPKEVAREEEWNNFMHRIGEVSGLVKDLASGDDDKASAAQMLADKYLKGTVITDENIKMEVKSDRTVINKKAFQAMEKEKTGEMDKEVWMREMGKDADRRAQDRKVRKEKADTLKTIAEKAFRRQDYDKALSCYNKAIEYVKDNAMLYCDRALTNIKLGKFDKVFPDCENALRLNERSFKARLYTARAHKELENDDQLQTSSKELEEMFPQHHDLVAYFLKDKEDDDEED